MPRHLCKVLLVVCQEGRHQGLKYAANELHREHAMSAKDGSVAPKERINIKYVPATGDQQAETELPLKMFVVGDFKGHAEETPIEDRKAISVDKNNFRSVMKEAGLTLYGGLQQARRECR